MSDFHIAPDLDRLNDPFDVRDLEWRPQGTAGNRNRVQALVYVTNRAIMERLDALLGPENWQNSLSELADSKGFFCGIGINVTGRHDDPAWIWKFDGSDTSNIEAVKGGISGSMKRAAVQWGIGRYLYSMPSTWVEPKDGRLPKDMSEHVPEWARPRYAHISQITAIMTLAAESHDEDIVRRVIRNSAIEHNKITLDGLKKAARYLGIDTIPEPETDA